MPAHKRGFTLVELLVVIAIIAVLSTVGLVTYSTVQKSGRMSKRIQDLKAIQTALELYYSVNKAYPVGGWRSECANWGGLSANDVVKDASSGKTLVSQFMPAFPSDPAMDAAASTSCYVYLSDGIDYKVADLNVSEITAADLPAYRNFWDPNSSGYPTPCSPVTGINRKLAIWTSDASRCW